MSKKSRLAIYLAYAASGGFGWVKRYEEEECKGQSAAWISGHYQGMLDELISAVGLGVACRIVAARDDLP